jgi:glycosyltransferase involved in cell wall biosynthesis
MLEKDGRPGISDILMVGSYPPPHGGQSVHIEKLVSYLKRDGFVVETLNTGANKEIDAQGIRNVRSSKELLNAILFDYKTRLAHVHTANANEFGKIIPICVASFVKNFKWVMTIHSGNIETSLSQIDGWKKWMIKMVLYRVDRIICVNDTIRTFLSSWTTPDKLKVIPAYSIDFSEQVLTDEMEIFLRNHNPIISCVGFFQPVYGFDLAIRAIKSLMSVHERVGLIIMGEKNNMSEYETMIRELRLNDHILICGNINHDTCLSVIRRSTLFLRPTLYDGDSISVREALALGTPVVASDTEFRPPGVAFFRKGDLHDMIEKITVVLKTAVKTFDRSCCDVTNLEAIKRTYLEILN